MDLLRRVTNELLPVLQRTTVPLYVRESTGHLPLGSAVLFRLGGRSFVVTAAHILFDIDRNRLNPVTADISGPGLAIYGQIHRFKPYETNDDPARLDLGVLELSQECIEALADFSFLELDDIDVAAESPPPGWYFVHGYPGEGFSDTGSAYVHQPYTHSAELYSRSESLPGFDAQVHVALGIDRSTLRHPHGGGPVTAPQTLGGVSGGAIWRAARSTELAQWTLDHACCVAIQTMQYGFDNDPSKLVVRGTRWPVLISLLWRVFPDLRAVIESLGVPIRELGEILTDQ
jgi:hypothetical protein